MCVDSKFLVFIYRVKDFPKAQGQLLIISTFLYP